MLSLTLHKISMQIPCIYKDLRSSCGVGVPLIHSFINFIKSLLKAVISISSMGFASQCFCLVVIVTLGALASQLAAARSLQDASMRERHEEWMASYGRVYKDTNEKQKRYKIFEANVALIESSNGDPNKPYKLSVNQFSDLTNDRRVQSLTE